MHQEQERPRKGHRKWLQSKQAPAAADEAEVIDLVGTSDDEDEAQGMIAQRPSRINIKREHAVESVAYDVGTVCNETDHSQENNRPNSVERNSVESLINTFVNAREMMEEACQNY